MTSRWKLWSNILLMNIKIKIKSKTIVIRIKIIVMMMMIKMKTKVMILIRVMTMLHHLMKSQKRRNLEKTIKKVRESIHQILIVRATLKVILIQVKIKRVKNLNIIRVKTPKMTINYYNWLRNWIKCNTKK